MKLTKEEIIDRIAEIFDIDANTITGDTRFKEDLKADSIDLYQMVVEFEDEIGVQFDEDELNSIQTVADVFALVIK